MFDNLYRELEITEREQEYLESNKNKAENLIIEYFEEVSLNKNKQIFFEMNQKSEDSDEPELKVNPVRDANSNADTCCVKKNIDTINNLINILELNTNNIIEINKVLNDTNFKIYYDNYPCNDDVFKKTKSFIQEYKSNISNNIVSNDISGFINEYCNKFQTLIDELNYKVKDICDKAFSLKNEMDKFDLTDMSMTKSVLYDDNNPNQSFLSGLNFIKLNSNKKTTNNNINNINVNTNANNNLIISNETNFNQINANTRNNFINLQRETKESICYEKIDDKIKKKEYHPTKVSSMTIGGSQIILNKDTKDKNELLESINSKKVNLDPEKIISFYINFVSYLNYIKTTQSKDVSPPLDPSKPNTIGNFVYRRLENYYKLKFEVIKLRKELNKVIKITSN